MHLTSVVGYGRNPIQSGSQNSCLRLKKKIHLSIFQSERLLQRGMWRSNFAASQIGRWLARWSCYHLFLVWGKISWALIRLTLIHYNKHSNTRNSLKVRCETVRFTKLRLLMSDELLTNKWQNLMNLKVKLYLEGYAFMALLYWQWWGTIMIIITLETQKQPYLIFLKLLSSPSLHGPFG